MVKILSEKDVKREVKKLLDKHKWFWWCPPANAYGRTGIADFHALRGGVFMVIETKFGKNKEPSPMQRAFLTSVVAESGIGFIVSHDTLQWFSDWLDAFDRSVQAVQKREMPSPTDGATMLDSIREMLP